MATITLPTTMPLGADCTWGQQRFDLTLPAADTTGTQQARIMAPPRWVLGLVPPPAVRTQAGDLAQWQALMVQLRGQVNVLAAWPPGQPAPRGTMRGSPTLAGAVAAGATSAIVTGGPTQASTTLLTGDFMQMGIGVGTSQLVMITAPATANGSGSITVTFEPPARIAFGSGTAVTLQRPLAYFRQRGGTSTWTYGAAGRVASVSALDLLETFTA